MKNLFSVILSVALTTGISNGYAQSAQNTFSQLKINTSTPEAALNSWWSIVDARHVVDFQDCKTSAREMSESRQLAYEAKSRISTGELQGVLDYNQKFRSTCHQRVFVRTVTRQEQVSNTKTEIYVNIKDATAMPAGTVLAGPFANEPRTLGKEYKYVLIKEKNNWLISEVQTRDPEGGFHPTRTWKPEYKKFESSFYTFILEQ